MWSNRSSFKLILYLPVRPDDCRYSEVVLLLLCDRSWMNFRRYPVFLRFHDGCILQFHTYCIQISATPEVGLTSYKYALHSEDRKSTRLNSSHVATSYAVYCLKKKKKI